LRVRQLKLLNFRNLEKITLDVSARINIFLGRNGQGKSNLLEGLSYLSLGRSVRAAQDRELIRFGADHVHISVEAEDGRGDSFRLEAAITRDGQKRIQADGHVVRRHAELVGRLPSVEFLPHEVELSKGAPDHRRRFLDHTLSICSAETLRHLVAYRRALAQKNRLLKQRYAPDEELAIWDAELVQHGVPVLQSRELVMPVLRELARDAYRSLAPDSGELALDLARSIDDGNEQAELIDETTSAESLSERFEAALQRNRDRERALRHALIGPHRDRMEMDLEGHALRRFGSQGEMRSAAIALKLAQIELLHRRTGERPIVFLDDIFSELDRRRAEALQDRLHREHQLFIATARLDDVIGLADWPETRAWLIEDGRLSPLANLRDAGEKLDHVGDSHAS